MQLVRNLWNEDWIIVHMRVFVCVHVIIDYNKTTKKVMIIKLKSKIAYHGMEYTHYCKIYDKQ